MTTQTVAQTDAFFFFPKIPLKTDEETGLEYKK